MEHIHHSQVHCFLKLSAPMKLLGGGELGSFAEEEARPGQ